MVGFMEGEWVWMPHPHEGWLAVQLLSHTPPTVTARSALDEHFTIPAASLPQLQSVHPSSIPTAASAAALPVDNLTELEELSEGSILQALRGRYSRDVVYTSISSLLLSINPYKLLPYYGPSTIAQYKAALSSSSSAAASSSSPPPPPHVYSLAHAAYQRLVSSHTPQSIIIAGESGSGKTESTKLVLQYLADISGAGDAVEQQLLQSNPIIEAFGNARTVANDNSSRFGKFIQVLFNEHSRISGCRIQQYLLEKSRVVVQAEGEANFHIFYSLCHGCTEQERRDFGLENGAKSFRILQFKDSKQSEEQIALSDVRKAMTVLNFSDEQQRCIFRVIAAILHLGNMEFSDTETAQQKSTGIAIKTTQTLTRVSQLLAMDEAKLSKALVTRRLLVGGEVITQFHSLSQCTDMVDSVCKFYYDSLFISILDHINNVLGSQSAALPSATMTRWIGVLDIFGFENFAVNHWEQLCINFANERLQQHFISHCLVQDQDEYRNEGLSHLATVSYDDHSAQCCELIAGKKQGIFDMIGEEIRLPKGSDANCLSRMHAAFDSNSRYRKPKLNLPEFSVRHYAGEVTYQVRGFIDKNRGDLLSEDMYDAMDSVTDTFIAQLLFGKQKEMSAGAGNQLGIPAAAGGRKLSAGNDKSPRNTSRAAIPTQGSIFRLQLSELMSTLALTDCHFIKCIKPNAEKAADDFDGSFVGRQLSYLGVREVIEVRKAGYPVRVKRPDWLRRYRLLSDAQAGKERAAQGEREEVEELMRLLGVESSQWFNGVSKVLMKAGVQQLLEERREQRVSRLIVCIQSRWRCRLLRRRYAAIKACNAELLAALNAPAASLPTVSLAGLDALISRAADLDLPSALLTRIKQHRHRANEHQTAIRALTASVKSSDRQLVVDAIARAKAAGLHADCAELAEAESWLLRHAEYVKGAEEAMARRDGALLRRWLAWADGVGLDGELEERLRKAEREVKEEEAVGEQLSALVKAGKGEAALDQLQQLLSRADQLKLSGDVVAQARRQRDQLRAEREKRAKEEAEKLTAPGQKAESWKQKLVSALSSKDLPALTDALAAVLAEEAEVRSRVQSSAQYAECLEWRSRAEQLLQEATDTLAGREETAMAAVLERCLAMGLEQQPAVLLLQGEVADAVRERELRGLLMTAIESRQEDILSTIISRAESRHRQRGTAVRDDALLWKAKGLLADLLSEKQLHEQDEAAARPEAEVRSMLVEQQSLQQREQEAEQRREEDELRREDSKHQSLLRSHVTFSPSAFLSPNLSIHLCPLLRSPDDFVKGKWMGKDRLKKSMLTHSKEAIPRSLTRLDGLKRTRGAETAEAAAGGEDAAAEAAEGGVDSLCEMALSVFKAVQGWMGDRVYSFPDSLALDILSQGVQEPLLRDEIYVQAIKQVRENAKLESLVRGWQLLGLLSECFLPSPAFLPYLYHFLLTTTHRADPLLLGYISYTTHTLHHSTPTLSAPSLTHITSFRDRLMHTLILPLHFPDGSSLDVEVSPTLNAAAIIRRVLGWMGAQDDGSLSLYMCGPGTSQQCIGGDECLLDYPASGCQDGSMFFLLKKRMFTRRELDDGRLLQSVVYHQCLLDACHGVYDLQRQELVDILSVHRRLVAVDYFPALIGKETQASLNIRQLKPLVFSYWDTHAIAEFERDVVAAIARQTAARVAPHPRLVFELLAKRKEFSAQLYLVQQDERAELPHSLLLAVNTYGLCLMNETNKSLISAFRYQHITGWASNSVRFCLRVLVSKGKTAQLNFRTQQGKRIVRCIQEYVEYLMAVQRKEKDRAREAVVAVGKVREEEKENEEGVGAGSGIRTETVITVL